ncbi:hypothetical protein [Niveibacterium sp. SC-1]|uniref:hypothetical protein n=1 Tax=Niveibacterium sp. SC-1 TaxID=3135646 RepID=UPI003120523C
MPHRRLCGVALGRCLAVILASLAASGAPAGEALPQAAAPGAEAAHSAYARGDFASAQAMLLQLPAAARSAPRALFEQALLDDAAGRHAEAQQGYEALRGTPLAATAAIPAAINLVAQNKLSAAANAFAKAGEGVRSDAVATYLQLWQLYLLARTHGGPSATLQAALRERTAGLRPANAVQRALVALYRGEGSVDLVLDAVAASDPDALARRDQLSEAVFFAGSYLFYVRGDRPAASLLFRHEMALPPNASSERLVIRQMLSAF